jgi:hypothetical protein
MPFEEALLFRSCSKNVESEFLNDVFDSSAILIVNVFRQNKNENNI